MNEKLEKLNRQKTAAEKKLIAAQHREKQLEHERKRLTRSERTHRLCTRAGMLEKFLREPTLLTDDDVMELLTFLFHGEAAQKKLDTLIEERRKTLTMDGSENPLFNKGAIIHRLKVVHCVLPKAPCRELMISAQDKSSAPIIQWKLHFPCAG